MINSIISLLLLFTALFILWFLFRSLFSTIPGTLRRFIETKRVSSKEELLRRSTSSDVSISKLLNEYEKHFLFFAPEEVEALIERIHSHHLHLLEKLSGLSKTRSSLSTLPLIEGLLTNRYELLSHHYNLYVLKKKISLYRYSVKQNESFRSLQEINIEIEENNDELKTNEQAIKKEFSHLVEDIERSINNSISNIH